jgi:hypothetical protein
MSKMVRYYECNVCEALVAEDDLREHMRQHTPQVDNMELEEIRKGFDFHSEVDSEFYRAVHCPQCGEMPVRLHYEQSLRCSRSVYEVNLAACRVAMHDDDDEADVRGESHHAYECKNGHRWDADPGSLDW